jgi:imidazolonepropionase-like amidohydrolase
MKRFITVFSVLLFMTSVVGQTRRDSRTVAFVNVNVVPMDKECLLRNQTVIVRDGVIAKIGDAKRIRVPSDAQRIDGAGKFLIPGLSDMHVHLFRN